MSQPPTIAGARGKRIALIILLSFAAVVGGLLLAFVLYRVNNASAIRKLEAKARQQGHPLTLANLATNYPPISDEENAAVPLLALWSKENPEYWKAFLNGERSLPQKTPVTYHRDLPFLGRDARQVARATPLSPESHGAAEDFLARQAEHLQAVRAALRRPRARFPVKIAEGFDALMPHLAELRSEAHLFRIDALMAIERGQVDEALEAIQNSSRIGNLLANEPLLISQLVRNACLSTALDSAERLLSRRSLSAAQLDRLKQMLDRWNLREALKLSLVGERAAGLSIYHLAPETLQRMANSTGDGSGGESLSTGGYRAGFGALRAIGLLDADQRFMLETMDRAIELADQETPQAFKDYDELFDKLGQKAGRFPPKIFSGLLLPALGKAAQKFTALEARRRAALVAVAIEQYRLAHAGQLPDNLGQLTPSLLKQVPLDPFDGQPLLYLQRQPGYVVYSVGSDGQDQYGQEKPAQGSARDYDETFTVER